MSSTDPLELFIACDLDGSGYIDQNELGRICTDLSPEQLTSVFNTLDSDGDGKISVAEFNEGFREMSGALLDISRCKRKTRSESVVENEQQDEYLGSLDESLKSLSCQEHICEMYQKLYSTENPALIQQFESIILGVVKDIHSYQLENERLVHSFQREKEHHVRHLAQLEQEMDNQVKNVEATIRHEVKSEAEQDHNLIRANMEDEIIELKENLKRLQQLETMFDKDRINVNEYDKLRNRADDVIAEKRQLQMELDSANTSLALAKSELVGLKQQYRDTIQELTLEKDNIKDHIREQDNLTRQLHLLHDANRRLHDKNDDLLSALESTRSSVRVSGDTTVPGDTSTRKPAGLSLEQELGGRSGPLPYIQPKIVTYPDDELEIESMGEDLDSGMSTLRDYNEVDNDFDLSVNNISPIKRHRRRRQRRARPSCNSDTELAGDDSDDEIDFRDSRSDRTDYVMRSHSRPGSSCSAKTVRSIERMDSVASSSSGRRKLPAPPHKVIVSEPERMYKVVLAGDAAVGKSSFIMRLCKDKFVPNLSSTLGVDFQTKVVDVDGRIIALQLWDTAGQERFRSIAKSYFRRADGVLLLYDCTYERSFLNVREWIQAIEDSAQKGTPIMFCANKCDLREDAKSEGRKVVSFEDGQRLSREYNSVFIETSAKSGDNILEAVVELGRLLKTNEDIEVKTVGLQLQEIQMNDKKTKCCGS